MNNKALPPKKPIPVAKPVVPWSAPVKPPPAAKPPVTPGRVEVPKDLMAWEEENDRELAKPVAPDPLTLTPTTWRAGQKPIDPDSPTPAKTGTVAPEDNAVIPAPPLSAEEAEFDRHKQVYGKPVPSPKVPPAPVMTPEQLAAAKKYTAEQRRQGQPAKPPQPDPRKNLENQLTGGIQPPQAGASGYAPEHFAGEQKPTPSQPLPNPAGNFTLSYTNGGASNKLEFDNARDAKDAAVAFGFDAHELHGPDGNSLAKGKGGKWYNPDAGKGWDDEGAPSPVNAVADSVKNVTPAALPIAKRVAPQLAQNLGPVADGIAKLAKANQWPLAKAVEPIQQPKNFAEKFADKFHGVIGTTLGLDPAASHSVARNLAEGFARGVLMKLTGVWMPIDHYSQDRDEHAKREAESSRLGEQAVKLGAKQEDKDAKEEAKRTKRTGDDAYNAEKAEHRQKLQESRSKIRDYDLRIQKLKLDDGDPEQIHALKRKRLDERRNWHKLQSQWPVRKKAIEVYQEFAGLVVKALGDQPKQPPRPGLIPQTGQAAHPDHWVLPEHSMPKPPKPGEVPAAAPANPVAQSLGAFAQLAPEAAAKPVAAEPPAVEAPPTEPPTRKPKAAPGTPEHVEGLMKRGKFVPKELLDAHPDLAVKYKYAKPKANQAISTTPITALPPAEFAAKVQAVAEELPHGIYGGKVFISDLFDHFHKADPSLTLEDFKAKLLEANRGRHLDMGQANEVQNMHPDDVSRSETMQGEAPFHYVRAENAHHTSRHTPDEIRAAWRAKSADADAEVKRRTVEKENAQVDRMRGKATS